jgi:predicted enzyme related to lactoylglutathione lyase
MSRVVHFELCADDPERAVKFYEDVFGWKIQKWDGPQDYWLATTGAKDTPGIDGAIMRRDPSMPSVINTIDVTALDDMIASVKANGGTVVAPRMTIPGVGYFAYCQDTEGNTFGMMQNDPSAA